MVAAPALVLFIVTAVPWLMAMPGQSVREPLAEPSAQELALAPRLESHVDALASQIGERNLMNNPSGLEAAAIYIESEMRRAGYAPERHEYELTGASGGDYAGTTVRNLIAEVPGTEHPEEIVLIGAHYDTVPGSPGADDNASGIAAMLELARHFRDRPQPRTLRFVAFVNEEPPFFMTPNMGSYAYAARSRERGAEITAMVSLDGIAYFTDAPESQRFPVPGPDLIYPNRGTFIGFVSRLRDMGLVKRAIGGFRDRASIPSEGTALPAGLPGIGWSDHWSFWQHDYPALMVTDTLPFRYPHYHSPADTPEQLDYTRLARVTAGLEATLEHLAR
jgi:Zn-dependent M28 family amino/carboxypeptidase